MTHPLIAQLMGDIPYLSREEVAAHPRLPQARHAFLQEFLKLFGDDPHVARLLIESARYMVFLLVIVNHAAQDPTRPETWATVGKLKKTLQVFGQTSARQIDILLTRLRDVGFLDITQSESDRRVRLLKPTEKAMAHDRDWLAAHYAPLATIYPERDYSLILSREPVFHVRLRRLGMAFAPAAHAVAIPPEVMLFFNRPGGYMFLAAILASAGEDGHAAISYADVGERFGYSRTHVRQVLMDAEAAGLVQLHARGGHKVEILPALWAAHDRGIAGGMSLHDMMYARTAAAEARGVQVK